MTPTWKLLVGDVREQLATLADGSVQCVCTSPPYWGLRDYGVPGQIGLEPTPDAYVEAMRDVFTGVRRVLADDGVCWLNLGDSYCTTPRGNRPGDISASSLTNPYRQDRIVRGSKQETNKASNFGGPNRMREYGLKHKDIVGIPWRVAFALQQPQYTGSIKDERDRIWLAAMLDAEGCMFTHKRKAGQFTGSGTTGQVAIQLGRSFVGIELNETYAALARERIGNAAPLFAQAMS